MAENNNNSAAETGTSPMALVASSLAPVAEKPAAEVKPATPASPATPEAPAATEIKPAGGETDLAKIINAAVESASRPLLDRLAKIEGRAGTAEKEFKGIHAREAFINDKMVGMPKDIYSRLLPATEDQVVLHKEAQKITESIWTWVKGLKGAKVDPVGNLTYTHEPVNIGGNSGGGVSPMQTTNLSGNAQQLVASAIRQQTV